MTARARTEEKPMPAVAADPLRRMEWGGRYSSVGGFALDPFSRAMRNTTDSRALPPLRTQARTPSPEPRADAPAS